MELSQDMCQSLSHSKEGVFSGHPCVTEMPQ